MSHKGMSIESVNLTKEYGGHVKAVDNLSFRFEGPGVVGYLGPNGAGKTTTLKLFTNLVKPTSGKALINEVEVAKDYEKALQRVSAIVESPEPYPYQSIGEFLSFIAKLRGLGPSETRNRIAKLKDQLSLEDLSKKCGKLSKGHKQRVVLASTLVSDPEIMFLDEPTTGLDPAETHDIKKLLNEIKAEKLLLMSSHLLYEVTEVCDKIAIIDHGKLLAIDTVQAFSEKFGSGREGVAGLEYAYLKLVKGSSVS